MRRTPPLPPLRTEVAEGHADGLDGAARCSSSYAELVATGVPHRAHLESRTWAGPRAERSRPLTAAAVPGQLDVIAGRAEVLRRRCLTRHLLAPSSGARGRRPGKSVDHRVVLAHADLEQQVEQHPL